MTDGFKPADDSAILNEKTGLSQEFFRKKDRTRSGYHFISDERFEQLTISARKQGALILRGGEEVEAHLDCEQAEASIMGDIIMFRRDVTVSEVLEEIYHFEQNRRKLNDDKDVQLRSCLNEIDAKEYLLRNRKRYRIPRKETQETLMQLEWYRTKLKKLEAEKNV